MMSGGAERVLSILSTPFADAFDSVEYIMWLKSDVFYKIDSRVQLTFIQDKCGSANQLQKMIWFRKHVKQESPTVILSFMVMINFSTVASLVGTRTNIIVAERNDPRFFAHGKALRKIIDWSYRLPCVKKILMQTQNNKDYFKGTLKRKTDIIFNPVIMSENYIGAALNTPKDDLIVSVGRLESQKRQGLIIRAFAELKKTHPSYRLVIYGEGNRADELMDYACELMVDDSVSLPGRSDNVWDRIRHARAFVMSSDYEGMSNSLIEAMCLGLPCISTKVSGATDLIEQGSNGILTDSGDWEQIYEALTKVVDDETYATSLGQSAVKVYEKLKLPVIEKQWIDILTK